MTATRRRLDPEPIECCWCPARFRTTGEVIAHEAEHRAADRRMREREVRPSATVTAGRFEAAAAAAQSPPSKPN